MAFGRAGPIHIVKVAEQFNIPTVIVPPSPGTFPVTTPLFSALLVSVIIIVGALTFFPALSLGPVLEHLLMNAGRVF